MGSGAGVLLVFDPIDGTTNYAHGLPIFCCSVALEVNGVPVVAAVYDPTVRSSSRPSAGTARG